MYSVYILQCADSTYYTGIALHAAERLAAHNSGQGAKYTRARLPARLVYQEDGYTKSAALKREKAIKSLPRAEKIKLLNGQRFLP